MAIKVKLDFEEEENETKVKTKFYIEKGKVSNHRRPYLINLDTTDWERLLIVKKERGIDISCFIRAALRRALSKGGY